MYHNVDSLRILVKMEDGGGHHLIGVGPALGESLGGDRSPEEVVRVMGG